ncbi:MAG: SDR family NAD(P)-dependent oxidoreductase, partial [Nitriliruptoraceae bacterium]
MAERTGHDAEAAGSPTALVTGAAGHLGVELCRLLVAAGFELVGVDRPGSQPPSGVRRWVEVDLGEPSSEVRLSAALEGEPRVDLVVAAAGVTALGSVDDTDDATFRHVMEVNYHGMLRAVRAALPGLRAAGGHLVVVSS